MRDRLVHADSGTASDRKARSVPQGSEQARCRRRTCRFVRHRSIMADPGSCRYIIAPVFPACFVCEHVEVAPSAAGRLAAAGWCAGRTSIPRRTPQIRVRRRQEIRRHADPFRLRLQEWASAGHRLEMGRPSGQSHAKSRCGWRSGERAPTLPIITVICGCGKQLSLQETVPTRAARRLPRRAAVAARPRSRTDATEAEAADADRDEHLLPAGRYRHFAAD